METEGPLARLNSGSVQGLATRTFSEDRRWPPAAPPAARCATPCAELPAQLRTRTI